MNTSILFPDIVNGCFETLLGLMQWGSVQKLHRDKRVRGVYWQVQILIVLWGYWNLFYYPHLDQFMSFTGGVILAAANTVWLVLAFRYRSN